MNPLLKPFDTAYQSAPFQEIKEEHYLPAFRELRQKKRLNKFQKTLKILHLKILLRRWRTLESS